MNGNIHRLLPSFANRWVVLVLACMLGLPLGASPALAQTGEELSAEQKKKLTKRLKKSFQAGRKAGNAKNFEEAAAHFEEALGLAQKLELAPQARKIQDLLVKSLKGAASVELSNDNYTAALEHYQQVLQYDKRDPIVHLNRGMAHLSMDSTDAGLQALQQAIRLGNEMGNTRVAGRATERIRSEFLATASQALQGDNPSEQQVNTALEALDRMQEYVEPNADAKFYRAMALYEGGQLEQAIQAAQEGIDMHQGSRSDAAKFYYVIGESQLELGNTAEACQTFGNAAYGDYQARAEHYLNNECEDV